MMKKASFPLMMVAVLLLAACAPGSTPAPNVDPTPTVLPTAAPSSTVSPTAPQPTPTAVPSCPEPTEGTQLLANEQYGYCLLYPAGYFRTDNRQQVCIAPDGFVFWETPCPVSIGVLDAAGRNLQRLADELVEQIGFDPGRSGLVIAGEEAVLLADVGGQSSMRQVLIVHEDRTYTLSFPFPVDDSLYNTIINSFTFVPIAPSPTETQAVRGTAMVVYVKQGDILLWEEATGQTHTIFEAGDVVRVKLSDDGQLVAFVRRGSPSLWVVERDGQNPRQLDTAQGMEWIPHSHRLLYSRLYAGYYLHYQGLTLLDVDTLARAELATQDEFVSFMPSPDGEHIALVTSAGPAFVNIEDSLAGQVPRTPPGGGVPGPFCGDACALAWTQDSTAFLVKGSLIYAGDTDPVFTLWRVPIDGTPATPLVTLRGIRDQLAPDGSLLAYVRSTGFLGASQRFLLSLPEELGPLAVLHDPFGLSWSPDGEAYVLGSEEMSPLCPGVAQAIEACGPSLRFGTAIESFKWLDRDRYLYVTYVPRRLMLGSLDGSATIIADDPQDPLFSDGNPSRASFDAVAATCVDDSEFVSDVTVPDGTTFDSGTVFIKTWRLRNSGTCIWDEAYRFAFLSGDRLSGPRSAPLGKLVEPGEEIELPVMLIAPETAGTYQGQWQLFAPDGTPFGTATYVVIRVP